MINRKYFMQLVARNPQLQKAVSIMEQRLSMMNITPQLVDEIIKTLEFVLEHPDQYGNVRAKAIQAGFAGPQDLPEKFEPIKIFSLLVAFYGISARMGVKKFAHGGLHQAARQIQAAGRGGDTILAHINPQEAEILRRMSGGGTTNPTTGVVEFKGGIGRIIGAVLPIAAAIIAPELIPAIGEFVSAGTLTGTAASVVGSAVIGAAGAALSGQNILKGAIVGGIGGGMGDWLGSSLMPESSKLAQSLAGNALAGGLAGTVSGEGALKGALKGAAGSMIGQYGGEMAQSAGAPKSVQSGLSALGKLVTAGQSPKDAVIGALLAGASEAIPKQDWGTKPGLSYDDLKKAGWEGPSNLSMDQSNDLYAAPGQETGVTVPQGDKSTFWSEIPPGEMKAPTSPSGGVAPGQPGAPGQPSAQPGTPKEGLGLNWKTAISAVPVLAALMPKPAQEAIGTLKPDQQEYMKRPSIQWDWNAMQRDAANAGMALGEYMSRNWNIVTSGKYNVNTNPASTTPQAAMGGPLARLARGAGTGRSDQIDAKLSDGEYVIDAETVALLGDGSTEAGARKLDEMRKKIRMQKGKVLARGKFSPNAKSPLQYIKGVA